MRVWGRKLGATLGIIAVAASLYLPVHIARYVVATAIDSLVGVAGASLCHAEIPVAERDGNDSAPYRHDGGTQHHDTFCPLCASASTVAGGILLPAPLALRAPGSVALSVPPEPAAPLRALTLHTPYAARAPPASA